MKIFIILLILFSMISTNAIADLSKNELNTIKIFNTNANSVVNITNYKRVRRGGFFFSGMDESEVPAGTGSGYVWNDKGFIVTNYHVVHEGSKFFVTFNKNKKQYEAKVVGAVPEKDIAVIKLIEMPKNLTPIKIGSSSELQVGQNALAIGNPFGLDHTMTKGIISALGRKIPGFGGVKIYGMIQTDCSINPGNSGGPLLNSTGELIGMNTMIYSQSGSSAGIGFAVPINTIKKIVPKLISSGKVTRPALGIGLTDKGIKDYLGLKKGIIIGSVDPRGPAAKAGLKGIKRDRSGRLYLGDILLSIGGNPVNNYDDIYHVLDNYNVGDTVSIQYKRDESIKNLKLKLTKLSRR